MFMGPCTLRRHSLRSSWVLSRIVVAAPMALAMSSDRRLFRAGSLADVVIAKTSSSAAVVSEQLGALVAAPGDFTDIGAAPTPEDLIDRFLDDAEDVPDSIFAAARQLTDRVPHLSSPRRSTRSSSGAGPDRWAVPSSEADAGGCESLSFGGGGMVNDPRSTPEVASDPFAPRGGGDSNFGRSGSQPAPGGQNPLSSSAKLYLEIGHFRRSRPILGDIG